MSIELMAPNGLPIVGTAEEAIGYAGLSILRRDENGVVLHKHSGRTEGFFDTQFTVEMGGTLYEDADGNWWQGDRLVPCGADVPDPVPTPDVWCGDQPSITSALLLGAENAKLRALLLEAVPMGVSNAAWPGYLRRVCAALGVTEEQVTTMRLLATSAGEG